MNEFGGGHSHRNDDKGMSEIGLRLRSQGTRSSSAQEVGNVIPFRPMRRRTPRRRKPTLIRWMKPFLGAVAIVSTPVFVAIWLLNTPQFALEHLQIEHTLAEPFDANNPLAAAPRVPADWAQKALRPFVGDNLLSLSLPRVADRLKGHPWIAGIDLRKEMPHQLSVRIIERQAVALVRQGKTLSYVDGDGRLIAPLKPSEPAPDLVVISLLDARSADLKPALALTQEMVRLDRAWAGDLSEVTVLGPDDFCIFTTRLPFALLVGQEDLEYKIRHLEDLLHQIRDRYPTAAAVDLRFSRRILIQPSIPEALRNGSTWQVERS